jgi:hypothetical protein
VSRITSEQPESEELVDLVSVDSEGEASMIANLLRANDILSAYTPPLAPVLGLGTGGIRIQVRASDLEQARELLP